MNRSAATGGGFGVNVIGFFRAEFGQGAAARAIVSGLERAAIPFTTITREDVPHRQEHPFEDRSGEALHPTNILCLNAEHLLSFAAGSDSELLTGRYSIGVWFWETSVFPEYLQPALDLVQEVWVASDFVAAAVAAETWKPVQIFPLPVEVPPAPSLPRAQLGLSDDQFVFLFLFDFYSTFERKNPIALVEAFGRAFQPGSRARLLIKTINGDRFPRELEQLQAAVRERPDVDIVDEYVPIDRVRALTAACDCYVSLHRSEGFGLTIAEAMAYGKPAIATGYSGNLAFMDEENSYLVGYTLSTVPEECGPYPAGAAWAEPDVDEAAELMRRVLEQPEEARARARRGQETILRDHSPGTMAAFLAERLPEVEALRARWARSSRPGRRAAAYLTSGPVTSWDAPSRLGRAGILMRKLLLRLLRPYIARHREFELAVVAALDEAELDAAHQREQVSRLERVVRRLEARLGELEERDHRSLEPDEAAH